MLQVVLSEKLSVRWERRIIYSIEYATCLLLYSYSMADNIPIAKVKFAQQKETERKWDRNGEREKKATKLFKFETGI